MRLTQIQPVRETLIHPASQIRLKLRGYANDLGAKGVVSDTLGCTIALLSCVLIHLCVLPVQTRLGALNPRSVNIVVAVLERKSIALDRVLCCETCETPKRYGCRGPG